MILLPRTSTAHLQWNEPVVLSLRWLTTFDRIYVPRYVLDTYSHMARQEKTWLNYVTILKRFKRPLGGHLTGKLTLKLFKCYIILFSGNLTTPAPDNDNWTVHLISNSNFTIIRIPPPPPPALHYVSPTSIATQTLTQKLMLNAHLPTGSRQLAISPTADWESAFVGRCALSIT